MGMFDTIYVDCPHCGVKLDLQTKDGPCMLKTVELSDPDASISILNGVVGIHTCYECDKRFHIKASNRPTFSAFRLTEEEEENFYE